MCYGNVTGVEKLKQDAIRCLLAASRGRATPVQVGERSSSGDMRSTAE
jgi:hypothetical protein